MDTTMSDTMHQELFSSTINRFIRLLNSQMESYPIIMDALRESAVDNFKKLVNFAQQNQIEIIKEDSKIKFSVPFSLHKDLKKLVQKIDRSESSILLTSKNAIVTFVGIYDLFLVDLINCVYQKQPDRIKSSDRQYTCKEILQFESIEEFANEVRNEIIESVMRDSHAQQLVWLGKRLNCEFTKFDNYKYFIEITEARNLFVHTGGKISKQYLTACKNAGYNDIDSDKKIGDEHKATFQYVTHCYNILFEIGVMLGQVVWRKLYEKDTNMLEKIETHLINVIFELLVEKKYDLAIEISKFAISKHTKNYDKSCEYIKKLNFAIAYHLKGEQSNCEQIISQLDFSNVEAKYKLASAVLRKNYSEACKIMKQIGRKDHEIKDAYKHWPLFRLFRETPEFLRTYKSIFRKDFNETIIRSEVSNINES